MDRVRHAAAQGTRLPIVLLFTGQIFEIDPLSVTTKYRYWKGVAFLQQQPDSPPHTSACGGAIQTIP